jgi:hypothetical protein
MVGKDQTRLDTFQPRLCSGLHIILPIETIVHNHALGHARRAIPSRPCAGEAKDAAKTRSCSLLALKTTVLPNLSWFLVSVPVLSAQRMSMPAISSIAARRETIAFILAQLPQLVARK